MVEPADIIEADDDAFSDEVRIGLLAAAGT
jgi:hypothetical protein